VSRETTSQRTRTIVIVNDTAYVNGGAAKVALSSAIGLAKRNWRVFLMSAVGPVAPELSSVEGLTVICTNQFEILTDRSRFRAMTQGLWNTQAHKSMKGLLYSLSSKETVVHVHLWAKALSSSVIRAAEEQNFPLILTLHDYLYSCPTGTLFNHKTKQICELKPMGVRCLMTNCDSRHYSHKVWRAARHEIQHNFGGFKNGFQNFIALTPCSSDVLRPALPSGARVRFISNFVDMARSEPTPVDRNSAFVFSGRLVPEKGPVLFAEAARQANVPAVFIGEGGSRDAVAAANTNAELKGWLSYEGGIEQLRKARALVVPSLWLEAQPLVILEAAANGIPVILADRCAARNLVEDGVTGLWFSTGDLDDLRKKIEALKDGRFAQRLGAAAYERYWAAPPTLEAHLDKLEELYCDVLRN
jgi:glycosyltransferase involved in cell wall biosynthesis